MSHHLSCCHHATDQNTATEPGAECCPRSRHRLGEGCQRCEEGVTIPTLTVTREVDGTSSGQERRPTCQQGVQEPPMSRTVPRQCHPLCNVPLAHQGTPSLAGSPDVQIQALSLSQPDTAPLGYFLQTLLCSLKVRSQPHFPFKKFGAPKT